MGLRIGQDRWGFLSIDGDNILEELRKSVRGSHRVLFFHAGNRGSNPLGDAKENQRVASKHACNPFSFPTLFPTSRVNFQLFRLQVFLGIYFHLRRFWCLPSRSLHVLLPPPRPLAHSPPDRVPLIALSPRAAPAGTHVTQPPLPPRPPRPGPRGLRKLRLRLGPILMPRPPHPLPVCSRSQTPLTASRSWAY
jgi:hypothetical protein